MDDDRGASDGVADGAGAQDGAADGGDSDDVTMSDSPGEGGTASGRMAAGDPIGDVTGVVLITALLSERFNASLLARASCIDFFWRLEAILCRVLSCLLYLFAPAFKLWRVFPLNLCTFSISAARKCRD